MTSLDDVAHLNAHIDRIFGAGGWERGEDNLPYLVSCLRGQRDRYKLALEKVSAKIPVTGSLDAVAVAEIDDLVQEALKD